MAWAMNHPFLALFIYLCVEALLPVRLLFAVESAV